MLDGLACRCWCRWLWMRWPRAQSSQPGALPMAEASPLPWLVARLRARRFPNVQIQRDSFYNRTPDDADAVTAYLMIKPMKPLAAMLDRVLRPGTPVVALTFWFRDRHPVAVKRGPGVRGDAALYRWPASRPTGSRLG